MGSNSLDICSETLLQELSQNEGDFLGSSQTGDVRKYVICGKKMAVKELQLRKRVNRLRKSLDEGEILKKRKLLEEYEVMKAVKENEHVIKVYGFIPTLGHVYLCMELMDRDLDSTINLFHVSAGKYLESLLLNITSSMINALDYCNYRNIQHRDIKPKNILINMNSIQVKLGDFGEANTSEKFKDTKGSPLYWPPEYLYKNGEYDCRSDIWSLGMTLLELVLGQHPFVEKKEEKDSFYQRNNPDPVTIYQCGIQKLKSNNGIWLEALLKKVKCSIEAKDFIRKCLIFNFEDKPGYKELKREVFYQENIQGYYYVELIKKLEMRNKEFHQMQKAIYIKNGGANFKNAMDGFLRKWTRRNT